MSNATQAQFHRWKPEPLTRGTFSILSSCVTTMLFCVWTAVHLNVPEYKKESHQFWRKIKWLFIALFAPEIVALGAVWQAWEADAIGTIARQAFNQPDPPNLKTRLRSFPKQAKEFVERHFFNLERMPGKLARWLGRVVQSLHWKKDKAFVFKEKPQENEILGDTSPERYQRYLWTSTHSLYAVMGGFAFDTHGVTENFLPRNRRRIVLTTEGLKFLLHNKPSLIPDIAEAGIQDKSKANGFVKAFVCLQAAWFCAQCFSRWKQHLAVSLLELNTLAHALCALLIYLLWWSKPLDVQEPTLIRGEESHALSAFMCLKGFRESFHYRATSYWFTSRYTSLEFEGDENEGKIPANDGTLELYRGDHAYGFIWKGDFHLLLQPTDVRCLSLAKEALKFWPKTRKLPQIRGANKWCCDRVKNFGEGDSDPDDYDIIFGFIIASGFYAGIHLVAWHHHFRTHAEAILWKTSGLVIGISGPIISVIIKAGNSVKADSRLDIFYINLLFPILFVYTVARIYIIVESFLDITYLPDSAFQVAAWSQYFWHAG